MRGDSYAWIAARQLHEENMQRKREQRAAEIIEADWDWKRHVDSALTVNGDGDEQR